jgi:outer membrane protein assembly factor BamA
VASLRTEYVPLVKWHTPFADRDLQSPPVEFLKAEARLGSFLALGATTLHVSSLGGHARTLSLSPVPLEDRFVLGGTGSMRGFARNTLGPRNLGARVDIDWPDAIAPVIEYTVRDDPDRWAPTGGDTYAMTTVEWLIPWTSLGMKSWDGYSTSLFVDAGNVWLFNTPASVSSQAPKYADLIPAVRVSSGIGLRIDSPVGPLQLDLASNLQTLGQSERARFLRTDWEEVPFRVHLALGALL